MTGKITYVKDDEGKIVYDIVTADFYLTESGAVVTSPPARRVSGAWLTLPVSAKDDPAAKAAERFAKAASSHKIEFWSDREFAVFDPCTFAVYGEILTSYISYVGTRSTDGRFYYRSGEAAAHRNRKTERDDEMSLTGITFANQKITPSDDGRLYGSMLADGILTGCGITFAAATLSVAAGSLLIGTRELRTSGETLSVTGATSGYARVIIDIDLTRAATKTSFEQARFKIQYAASLDAFASLEQQDINTAGTHYQAVFCVLSLGTAGITGVVSSLARRPRSASPN